ncbi:MAG: hypothetical protein HZB55_18460 [Deltaproteobacteria bacterium]|nr:hypothetical protein [Deltaproteobacteria bacterium]
MSSDTPLTVCREVGGVRVEVCDESAPYAYSNLWHVKLRVVAHFPETEAYERVLERMGVYDQDRARVRGELIGTFEATALPYVLRPDFPQRAEERRRRETDKVVRFPGVP